MQNEAVRCRLVGDGAREGRVSVSGQERQVAALGPEGRVGVEEDALVLARRNVKCTARVFDSFVVLLPGKQVC